MEGSKVHQLEGRAGNGVHGVGVEVVATEALQVELEAAQRRDGRRVVAQHRAQVVLQERQRACLQPRAVSQNIEGLVSTLVSMRGRATIQGLSTAMEVQCASSDHLKRNLYHQAFQSGRR